MSEISDKIINIYNSIGEERLSENVITEAKSIIMDYDVHDTDSLFYAVAALNLLNRAAKESTKNQIFYAIIKTKISQAVEDLILNPNNYHDAKCYYDASDKCLYVSVYDIVFSYHLVKETPAILNVATKLEPITWPGIKLQNIAQQIYFIAKQRTENSKCNLNESPSAKVNIEALPASSDTSLIEQNSHLMRCPDCGKLISKAASSCPNCGWINTANIKSLFTTIMKGMSVKLTYNGIVSIGKVENLTPFFVELSLAGGNWVRIRLNAVDSVELQNLNMKEEANSEDTIAKIDTFAEQASVFFIRIFETAKVDKESLIVTNSTITRQDKPGFVVLTDEGKEVKCVVPGIVGYKKKLCVPGKRVYCVNVGTNNLCYCSIMEMSYGGLIGFFNKAILALKKDNQWKRVKTQTMNILTFLQKEMSNDPEIYLELKDFKKQTKLFLGQIENGNNDDEDNTEDVNTSDGNSMELVDHKDITKESSTSTLFMTNAERLIKERKEKPVILGRIDLNTIPDSKRVRIRKEGAINDALEKPTIIDSKDTKDFLSKRKSPLLEKECKDLEKELSTMIRNGYKEQCLEKSYEIIETRQPTPKYLRSYLDRIVNTEIALNHSEQAIRVLAILIAYSEHQPDVSDRGLSHLYLTMGRVYIKMGNNEEALKALDYALHFNVNEKAIQKLKSSISSDASNEEDSIVKGESISPVAHDFSFTSRMLVQDVKQKAGEQELQSQESQNSAAQLFGKAQKDRENTSIAIEERAEMFLNAAAAYYNSNQVDTNMYKTAVANYARMKGQGMFSHFVDAVHKDSGNLLTLQAYKDSACSYYLEALGIYNTLGDKSYLQELFLKYLQMSIVVSNVEGGKTPDSSWEEWTLDQLQQDCIKGDGTENQKVFFETCVSVGAKAEGAWNKLYGEALFPFMMRLRRNIKFRQIFNSIEHSAVPTNYNSVTFLHAIFEHRQKRTKELQDILDNCLSWVFSPFDIKSFEDKWSSVKNYIEIFTSTDVKIYNAINTVLGILEPYASRKENERLRILSTSQQALLDSQKVINSTTTYYGRVFFSHLIEVWVAGMGRLIKEYNENTFPKLEIEATPPYIKESEEDEKGFIDFVVTNHGDSTAQSFTISADILGHEYMVSHSEELPAGVSCAERIESLKLKELEYVDVTFKLTVKYQGKDLPTTTFEASYEREIGDVITDDSQIPWSISNTPKEQVFKGREEILSKLVLHYLSRERAMTYILYGLTRTGKSSILDYLCKRINGRNLMDEPQKKIMTFQWDLSKITYSNSDSSPLWANLLNTCLYEKLPDDIADVVDGCYHNGQPPLPKNLRQEDFEKMIDAISTKNIVPLITIDEFSTIKPMLKSGVIDSSFIKLLREMSLKGKACFVYAGTYDIKDLPRVKEYGFVGQMTNTISMPINEIEDKYADELIDAASPKLIFDNKAKAYIRALSGCVPYWIQWICLECGKYAITHKRKHLGYNEVDHVVRVLTGEDLPNEMDTWDVLDEMNFHNNQIDPKSNPEKKLISSISYLIKGVSTQIERGVSMDELKRLWNNYNVPESKQLEMIKAAERLKERKVLRQFTDENREVYRLNVDLFRRWWYAHHRDITLVLAL